MPDPLHLFDDLAGDDDDDAADDDATEDDIAARYHELMEDHGDLRTIFSPGTELGLPESVVVGSRMYSVHSFDPGMPGEPEADLWHGLRGRQEPGSLRILVRSGQGAHEGRVTAMHELLHAVDLEAGTWDQAGEPVVDAWAPVLLEALRKNPGLVAFLLTKDGPLAG